MSYLIRFFIDSQPKLLLLTHFHDFCIFHQIHVFTHWVNLKIIDLDSKLKF